MVIPDSGLCVPLFFPGVLGHSSKLHLAHPESWARWLGPGMPAGREGSGALGGHGPLLPPAADTWQKASLSNRGSNALPGFLASSSLVPAVAMQTLPGEFVLPASAAATGEPPGAAGSGWASRWVTLGFPHLGHNLSSLSPSVSSCGISV